MLESYKDFSDNEKFVAVKHEKSTHFLSPLLSAVALSDYASSSSVTGGGDRRHRLRAEETVVEVATPLHLESHS